MFERFDTDTRAVIVRAQESARGLQCDYIGTEHLLIGLLLEPGDVVRGVLEDVGVSAEVLREATVAAAPPGTCLSTPGHIPFTPRAKKVLEQTLRVAVRMKSHRIRREHLLLGLLATADGIASRVLLAAGLVEARVESVVRGATATGEQTATGETAVVVEALRKVMEKKRRGHAEERPSGPLCPGCERALSETLAHRVLEVPEDGGARRARLLVVFCEACGHTLQTRIEPETE